MGIFGNNSSSVAVAPAQPDKDDKQRLKKIRDENKAQSKHAAEHAGLELPFKETPIELTGARQYAQQIAELCAQVHNVAPGYAISEPDNPDNPDAVRVEALGLVVGYLPKGKCKRMKRLGDNLPVYVVIDHFSAPKRVEIVVPGIL